MATIELYEGQNYFCSCCGRRHIRLYRPIDSDLVTLICTSCAIKNQASVRHYSKDEKGGYTIPTILPEVRINPETKEPEFPAGYPHIQDDDLLVMLPSLKNNRRMEAVRMIPAIPVDSGNWLMLPTSTPHSQKVQGWHELPI